MGKSKLYVRGNRHTSTTANKRISIAKIKGNPFYVLDVEELYGFLKLPGELRDQIYGNVIDDTSSLVIGGTGGGPGRSTLLQGAYALLLTNKQVHNEFRAVLYQRVPHQFVARVDTTNAKGPSLLAFHGFQEDMQPFPTAARHPAVYLQFRSEGAFEDAEHYQLSVIQSKGFGDVVHLLLQCKEAKQLMLHMQCDIVTLETQEDEAEYHTGMNMAMDEEQYSLLYESIVQVVESLPNLVRYCITVAIAKDWDDLHSDNVYASRSIKEPWDSAQVVRFSNRLLDQPQGEWLELRNFFHVERTPGGFWVLKW